MVSWPILRSSSAIRRASFSAGDHATPPDAGKGQIAAGAPLAAPAFQQMGAQLIFPRNFTVRGDPASMARIAAIFRSRL